MCKYVCGCVSISFLLTARGGAFSTGFPSHVRAGRVLIPTKSPVTWVTSSMCTSTKGRPTQEVPSCIFSRKQVKFSFEVDAGSFVTHHGRGSGYFTLRETALLEVCFLNWGVAWAGAASLTTAQVEMNPVERCSRRYSLGAVPSVLVS